jgi:hypothetical protein
MRYEGKRGETLDQLTAAFLDGSTPGCGKTEGRHYPDPFWLRDEVYFESLLGNPETVAKRSRDTLERVPSAIHRTPRKNLGGAAPGVDESR